ncbi:toxin of addiction system [Marinobacter salicampi]|uniref:toxin of addiction system n=1 Tax=Marinobacter salicampi TaxID=435907 RepID=UPI0014081C2E|nr:toxin of addiction system [Marinobacter salicampi]
MSNLSALTGCILFAWLPEDENPHQPGPKFRPVLVVDADPEGKRLCLAYGTSQRVDQNGKGEITFRRNEIDGLAKDTKFCLGKTKWVPMTAEYFSKTTSSVGLAVIGFVPKKRTREILMRLEEVIAI